MGRIVILTSDVGLMAKYCWPLLHQWFPIIMIMLSDFNVLDRFSFKAYGDHPKVVVSSLL